MAKKASKKPVVVYTPPPAPAIQPGLFSAELPAGAVK